MKPLFLLSLCFVIVVACSPNAQLVTLRANNLAVVAEGLVMENDTLVLRYNFASERGLMQVSLLNKLNQPLYVDWKRSSLIIGQNKIDYWYDVADVNLVGSSFQYSHYVATSLNGTISKEDKVSFIPPQTKLEKRQFILVPDGNLHLSGQFKTEQEQARWINRKKPVEVNVYTYSADQSPLMFRNYLTLSTDKDFKTEFNIDTKFWASNVKVLPRDQILSRFNGTFTEMVPFKKADSFYVPLSVN